MHVLSVVGARPNFMKAAPVLVVVGAEAVKDMVGGVEIASASQAEFTDQAVLAGAPGAFGSPFGLGE